MKQFLILYGMPGDAMEKMREIMSPEEMEKGMEEWKEWQNQHEDNIPEPGNPVAGNTRVAAAGAADAPNEIAGYSVMQGETKEEVVEMVKNNPHFKVPGGYVEVMEIMPMG